MNENQAGVTAMATAFARAYHATYDSDKIFDDFLAMQFFQAEERAFFEKNMAGLLPLLDPERAACAPQQSEALAQAMQQLNGPITLGRSRYTEDCLAAAVAQGVRQYVILGAGLDTFAFRWPQWAAPLQVYEVDHPVTQGLKRQRLARLGWETPAHLHFAALDFSNGDLAAALRSCGYDFAAPGFFSWLGVTFYLSKEVVAATLQAVAAVSAPGSTLVFDYIDGDALHPLKAGRRMRLMQYIVRQSGEPIKTGFAPDELAGLLASHGFRLVQNPGPAEIEALYFSGRSDDYHAADHVHFARCERR